MNRMDDESGDQKKLRIGRVFSLVSGLAWLGSDRGATQMFITPSLGAPQASHLPSGLIRPRPRLGLPNSFARSIRGVDATVWAAVCETVWAWVTEGRIASAATAAKNTVRMRGSPSGAQLWEIGRASWRERVEISV